MNLSQNDIRILYQDLKQYRLLVELLNSNMQTIDTLEGDITGGSFNIDSSSNIRRTCNIGMINNDESFTDESSRLWLDKKVRIKIGSYDCINDNIIWTTFGLLQIRDVSFSFSVNERTISMNCVDLMSNLTGDLSGKLEGYDTTIPAYSNIRHVIISTITQLSDIKSYIVEEDINEEYRITPYTIEFGLETTAYDILDKLLGLYPGWEMFFDQEGTFIYQKIPTCEYDPDFLNDEILSDLILSEGTAYDFTKIKNCIHVFGDPNAEENISEKVKLMNSLPDIRESDVTYIINPESPFSVEKIKERWEVFTGGEYDYIYTKDLCLQRAEYELWLSTNMNNSLELECILIPWMDVNKKFSHVDKSTKTLKQYISKQISFDFSSYIMRISSIQFYPLYPHLISGYN